MESSLLLGQCIMSWLKARPSHVMAHARPVEAQNMALPSQGAGCAGKKPAQGAMFGSGTIGKYYDEFSIVI